MRKKCAKTHKMLNYPLRQLVLLLDIANVTAEAVNSAFCKFSHTLFASRMLSQLHFFFGDAVLSFLVRQQFRDSELFCSNFSHSMIVKSSVIPSRFLLKFRKSSKKCKRGETFQECQKFWEKFRRILKVP